MIFKLLSRVSAFVDWLLDTGVKAEETLTPTASSAAEAIVKDMESTYSTRHELVPANPREFKWVDLRFYDARQADLEALGFRKLGDIEDLTLTRTYPQLRTFMRLLTSRDGRTQACIYHCRPKSLFSWMGLLYIVGILPRDMRVFEFMTEFDNGCFIDTTVGGSSAGTLNSPPEISPAFLRPETNSPAEALAIHHRRVQEYLEIAPELDTVAVGRLDDLIEMGHRQQDIKNIFRSRQGMITREELIRMGASSGLVQEATEVANEVERMKFPPRG